MDFRVGITEPAELDLVAIVRFIAKDSPAAARRLGDELFDLGFSLKEFPHRGAPVRGRPGYRRLVHRHYVIFYQVDEVHRKVDIIRVWDGRRNPSDLNLS